MKLFLFFSVFFSTQVFVGFWVYFLFSRGCLKDHWRNFQLLTIFAQNTTWCFYYLCRLFIVSSSNNEITLKTHRLAAKHNTKKNYIFFPLILKFLLNYSQWFFVFLFNMNTTNNNIMIWTRKKNGRKWFFEWENWVRSGEEMSLMRIKIKKKTKYFH